MLFRSVSQSRYAAGKYKAGKITKGIPKTFLTHIKPSQKAVKAHTEAIKGVIKKHKTAPQSALISRLNPIIRGWANCYSGVVSTDTFNKLDYTIWSMLRAWTVSRCGKANYKKLSKYFGPGTVKLSNGKNRACKDCGSKLSIYNDDPLCTKCSINPGDVKKAIKEIKGLSNDKSKRNR